MKDIRPHGAAAVIIAGFFSSVGRARAAVNIMPANIGVAFQISNAILALKHREYWLILQ